jgi:hypothetical protein
MSIPLMEYGAMPVYAKISHRFREKYRLQISSHIQSMSRVSSREEEGITFMPFSQTTLIEALRRTGAFHHDDRDDVGGMLAAAATRGEGYREISDISLHCQVGKAEVNIHVDYLGFVWRGPNGESLAGPDAVRHIADELGWGKIVELVGTKSEVAAKVLERVRPVVPSSANKFVPVIGIQYDLIRGETSDMRKQWSLSLQWRYGCTSYSCSQTEEFKGLVLNVRN